LGWLCTQVAASIQKCEEEHVLEAANFDALGRLLVDVRSCTRRGGKEANELANELCKSAEAVRCVACGAGSQGVMRVMLQAALN
jgi:hypothetical protein